MLISLSLVYPGGKDNFCGDDDCCWAIAWLKSIEYLILSDASFNVRKY